MRITFPGDSPCGDRARSILPIVAAVTAAATDMQILAPLLASIARDLGVELGRAALLVTSYSVSSAIVVPLLAPLSARFGANRMARHGLLLLAAGAFLCGVSKSYAALLLGRVICGVGGGMALTLTHVYVSQVVAYDRRGAALGWLTTGFFISSIVGLPIGAALAEAFSFRAAFLMIGLLCLGAWRLLRPYPELISGRIFFLGDYRALLATPGVRPAIFAFGCFALGFMSVVTFLGAWLETRFHLTTVDVGFVFMIAGIAALPAGPLSGHLSDRFGKKRLSILANLLMMATLAALPFATSGVIATGIFCIGYLLSSTRFTTTLALFSELVPPDLRSPLLLANNAAVLVGVGLGSSVGGLIYGSHGFAPLAFAGSAVTLAAAVLVMRIPEYAGRSIMDTAQSA